MKILFVSDTYFPHVNGVYYFVRRLGVLLQEKGHQVAVLVPSENLHDTQKIIDGLAVYGVPSLPVGIYPEVRFPIAFNLRATVKRLIDELNPDVIHIQDHFLLAKVVVDVSKDMAIPIIGTNHFMPENVTALLPFNTFNRRLEKWMWSGFVKVFDRLALVTTPSEMAARLIHSKLGVDVIPVSNGIDLERFNPVGDPTALRAKYAIPSKPILLYVGRLDPEKQLDDVLRAVALARRNVDFCFVLVGKGTNRDSLERLSKELDIDQQVLFAGFVPDEELPSFYRMSRCFIMASTAELQSISTMEAMASGLPVIAANAGALDELVHNGENGYLFAPGDIKTMSRCIEQVIQNKSLAQMMGHTSLQLIRRHAISQTVQRFETIYEKLRKEYDKWVSHVIYP